MADTMTVTRTLREQLPAPLARTAGAVRRRLRGLRYALTQLPAFPPVGTEEVRLLVGPTNSAGQGDAWARSARTLPGVGATSFAFQRSHHFAFETDYGVPIGWFGTPRWQRAQEQYVLENYTHVLVESLRPLLGARGVPDASEDLERFRVAGIQPALVFHGSDIRLPSRHAKREPWSPFTPGDDLTDRLEAQALRHAELVGRLSLPVFVSTPDLLDDVPDAQWLPIVIDPTPWQQAAQPLFAGDRPVVVHVPSNAKLKGTDVIDEVLTGLRDRGLIEYRRITGVRHDQMPALIGSADIVVDQLRIGLYGVAAVESLAAGRVVVSHLGESLRRKVRTLADREVPIVEADPGTLGDVVAGLVADPDAARAAAAAGPGYVAELHDGSRSAVALTSWLTSKEIL